MAPPSPVSEGVHPSPPADAVTGVPPAGGRGRAPATRRGTPTPPPRLPPITLWPPRSLVHYLRVALAATVALVWASVISTVVLWPWSSAATVLEWRAEVAGSALLLAISTAVAAGASVLLGLSGAALGAAAVRAASAVWASGPRPGPSAGTPTSDAPRIYDAVVGIVLGASCALLGVLWWVGSADGLGPPSARPARAVVRLFIPVAALVTVAVAAVAIGWWAAATAASMARWRRRVTDGSAWPAAAAASAAASAVGASLFHNPRPDELADPLRTCRGNAVLGVGGVALGALYIFASLASFPFVWSDWGGTAILILGPLFVIGATSFSVGVKLLIRSAVVLWWCTVRRSGGDVRGGTGGGQRAQRGGGGDARTPLVAERAVMEG